MHDYFEILGVSPDARAPEIRRARQRRLGVSHPDVQDGEARGGVAAARTMTRSAGRLDVAIDFVDMAALVDRMQTAFFREF